MKVTWEISQCGSGIPMSLTSHPSQPRDCSKLSPNSCHLLWPHSHRRRTHTWRRRSRDPCGTPWHTLCTHPPRLPFCRCDSGTCEEQAAASEPGRPNSLGPANPHLLKKKNHPYQCWFMNSFCVIVKVQSLLQRESSSLKDNKSF